MHHYPFHVGDYASHTQHLDETEDLIYRRCLDYIYLNEINLPESTDEIARLIRMRTHCERIANVMREFFRLENGEWVNKRASLEIAAYREKSDKAKRSARKRWENSDANALRTQSEGNANQNQNQNQNQDNKTLLSSGDDEKALTKEKIDYDGIVDAYHRILPELPPIRKLTPKRKAAIRARCKDGKNWHEMEFWELIFQEVRKNPHNLGNNDRGWQAHIDYITRQDVFIKLYEKGCSR